MPEFLIEEKDNVLVVKFSSKRIFADAVIEQVGDELLDAVDKAKSKILLDFEGVEFMSSLVIGKLVLFRKKCKAQKVDAKLCSICPSVMGVFEVTRLDKIFKIYDSEEEALEEFEGN